MDISLSHGQPLKKITSHVHSVADPDPGSGAFLTPWSGIRNRIFQILDPNPYIWELSDNFMGKKLYNSLKIDPNFFLQHFKTKIIINLWNFFSPFSFVAVLGSGIRDPGCGTGKNQNPGSGISIPDPQRCMFKIIFQSRSLLAHYDVQAVKKSSYLQLIALC